MNLSDVRELNARLHEQIGRVVVGQDAIVDHLFIALLAQGHVLLEGVPGTAKTLMARAFAACLELAFNRIQFTPDLMPGDVLGTNLFNFQKSAFVLTRGPIFTEVLLADEINRTPPKTQAALLQAMQERVVTIDGTTYPLGAGFMVVATQNPIEQEGTYPLPEAQLDRFLFKLKMDYPSREEELEMVRRHGHRTAMPKLEDFGLERVAHSDTLEAVRKVVAEVHLGEELVAYVVDLVRATRNHEALLCGTSPRSANMLATAARAQAAIAGRAYVIPDDVKGLAVPTLGHRVVLAPAAEIEGVTTQRVLEQIVERTPAPK